MKQSLKILLVEDEAMIALCLQLQLEMAGYEVCQTVATGEEAITAARQGNADVILMDIRLAGELDGIEAASRIRGFSDVPIIFTTGYSDSGLMERADYINPLGYFIKPVKIYQITVTIERFFETRSSLDS